MRHRKWIGVMASLLAVGTTANWAHAQALGPTVITDKGPIRAAIAEGVENFFGIPYAAPPAGDLRWRAPQPATPWTETRDGGTYGSACPQGYGLDSARTEDEDCLFLNVQRPEGVSNAERLPVVVVIHGGGWQTGSGNNENLDALVRKGRVVGVTMNYRLGSLGFLAHPALTREDGQSGNYGLMDQQAALRWVRDNINRFGGDPARVTIGGESAGGGSVCTHMTAPGSKGLFAQAFMMSTLCVATPLADAEKQGEEIAIEVGCSDGDTLSCLREKPVSAFLDAKTKATRETSGTAFQPTDPWVALEAGDFTKVPVIIGATRDEGRSFLTDWATRSVPLFDQEEYEGWVRKEFGAKADAVLTVYPFPHDAGRYGATYQVAELMIQNFVPGPAGLSPCKTSRITETLARQVPVWAYEVAHETGPGWFEVPGYLWGTGHATELPYLIPNRGNAANNARAFGDAERELSKQMLGAWSAFANTGNPSVADGLQWPAYQSDAGPVMFWKGGGKSNALPVEVLRAEHRCEFWDGMALE